MTIIVPLFDNIYSPTIAVDYFSPKIRIYYKKLLKISIVPHSHAFRLLALSPLTCSPLGRPVGAPRRPLNCDTVAIFLFLLFHFRRQNYKKIPKYAKIFAYLRKKQYFCTRFQHHPLTRCHCGSVGRATHS